MIVPIKLPMVLMAVNRPTFPPTFVRDAVMTRTRKGTVIASRPRGTKNRINEASSDPTAKLNPRHQYETGLQASTATAMYAAAARIAQYNRDTSCDLSANLPPA